jgi:hypothetical protein
MKKLLNLSLALCVLLMAARAFAFGTPGADHVHETVTRQGLGSIFEPKSLDEIAGKNQFYGAVGQPDDVGGHVDLSFKAEYHCDNSDYLPVPDYPRTKQEANNQLLACVRHMRAMFDKAVKDASELLDKSNVVDNSQTPSGVQCNYNGGHGRAKCNVMEDLGLLLHASQDFYSHSNWVDTTSGPLKIITTHIQDSTSKDKVLDWVHYENIPGLGRSDVAAFIHAGGSMPVPDGVITGCFAINTNPEVDAFAGCNKRVHHHDINHDHADAPRGNHPQAVAVAAKDTTQWWNEYVAALKAHYGESRGSTMACAISHDNPDAACPKLPVNAACESNSDCQNRACARATAADNAGKVCCASGKFETYAGYDYCLNMPDKSVCWSDAMCSAGTCRGNSGGTRKGICGKLAVAEACESNGDCQNGACARATADDGAGKVCCAGGRFGHFGGYDYCYGMGRGSVCWSDAMCASGNCKGNASGLKKGHCE